MTTPAQLSYKEFSPSSECASAAGRGASRKSDTKPELLLRHALWRAGARYRKSVQELPGKPDIVFKSARIAIFCDGDFWHGKNWKERKQRLKRGSNPDYWVAKIERNIERDRENTRRLQKDGWTVHRFWESEIYNELNRVVSDVLEILYIRMRRVLN